LVGAMLVGFFVGAGLEGSSVGPGVVGSFVIGFFVGARLT
jgi:hypothetical protein